MMCRSARASAAPAAEPQRRTHSTARRQALRFFFVAAVQGGGADWLPVRVGMGAEVEAGVEVTRCSGMQTMLFAGISSVKLN